MGNMFNTDSGFSRFMNRIADLFILNILWIFCSLPIVTIGAATTALYSINLKILNKEEESLIKTFFKAFKENFKKSTIIWLFILIISIVLGFNLIFWLKCGLSLSYFALPFIFFSLLIFLLVTPYIFPILTKTKSSILNIVLDLILVKRMGVSGAAVATVSAQAVSGIICLFYTVRKYKHLDFSKNDWKISPKHILQLCKMGIPMGLQYSITAIGSVILQTAVNNMGSTIVAAVTAGSRVSMFVCCPYDAMGSTMATYGGQNKGAAKYDRIDEGLKACIKLGVIYSLTILVFMIFFSRYLALLFVSSKETALINKISMFLIGNALFYVPLALVNIVRFMIQGIGFPGFAILAGVCEMIARSIAGFVLVPIFGYIFVVLASPLAWICADMFLLPAYRYVMKKSRGNV